MTTTQQLLEANRHLTPGQVAKELGITSKAAKAQLEALVAEGKAEEVLVRTVNQGYVRAYELNRRV